MNGMNRSWLFTAAIPWLKQLARFGISAATARTELPISLSASASQTSWADIAFGWS
jgi:hypothetical protein